MERFEQRISIAAPIEVVWTLLSNVDSWPRWFFGIDQLSGFDPSNGHFFYRSGSIQGMGQLLSQDAERGVLTIETQSGEQVWIHTFDIDRSGGMFGIGGIDATLLYRLETGASRGLLANAVGGLFGSAADDTLGPVLVNETLEKVKQLAENRATAS